MKQVIVLALLCVSTYQLSATQIKPSQDTITFPKWSFGLQSEYSSNGGFATDLGFGVFAERRLSSLFALEAELSYIHSRRNPKPIFRDVEFANNSINLSLFGKLYFGKNRRLYSKLGYRFKSSTSGFKSQNDIILGIGHNLPLQNGHGLKLEYNMSYNASLGVNGGVKLGYRF